MVHFPLRKYVVTVFTVGYKKKSLKPVIQLPLNSVKFSEESYVEFSVGSGSGRKD